jgi:hypothetical protein
MYENTAKINVKIILPISIITVIAIAIIAVAMVSASTGDIGDLSGKYVLMPGFEDMNYLDFIDESNVIVYDRTYEPLIHNGTYTTNGNKITIRYTVIVHTPWEKNQYTPWEETLQGTISYDKQKITRGEITMGSYYYGSYTKSK